MKWLKNLSNAIEYIENNLDKKISYKELAHIACCSTCYFQRMFYYVSGISLSEYIRRRQMTQAAFELQNTNKKVLDVALKYGYTSPTAFNRAFKNVHGIAPSIAKNRGSILNAYPPIKFSIKITGENVFTYHIAQKKAIRIVGIRKPLTETIEENQKIIPNFWQEILFNNKFFEISKLSNDNKILGVSVYQNPKNIFYYIAVNTDKEIPTGMYEYKIPDTTWLVFESDGAFKENVQEIFQYFYTDWLLFSNYKYAGLPDIEVYPIDKEKHCEVWIAVKQKES